MTVMTDKFNDRAASAVERRDRSLPGTVGSVAGGAATPAQIAGPAGVFAGADRPAPVLSLSRE